MAKTPELAKKILNRAREQERRKEHHLPQYHR